MKVKSLRALHLRSLSGHTVFIPADTATDIPDACAKEAFAAGCVAVEAGPTPAPELVPATPVVSEDDQKALEARANKIQAAIEELIAVNDLANFKPDGVPKHAAVMKLVGIVSNAEIEQVWATMTHPPKD